jgi:hypothetical protein
MLTATDIVRPIFMQLAGLSRRHTFDYGFGALASEENFFSVSVPWQPTPSPHT